MTNYFPITATPLKNDNTYKEILPCELLRPYIRCYWGSGRPYCFTDKSYTPDIVIPDTCVDIIYYIDYTDNSVEGGFCGINDECFYAAKCFKQGHNVTTFGIRFYAWSAYKFAEDSLCNTKNEYLDIQSRFAWLDRQIRHNLLYLFSLEEKTAFVQSLLMKKAEEIRAQSNIDNAINIILSNNGNIEVSRLSAESYLSSRQLERVFREYIGITPKKLCNLIRYQFLWRDICFCSDFDIMDAVLKYGYTDQSHLIREFKRYHSLDIGKARAFAENNVGNIQDK